ncbi:MAG: FIST C-terminal domain-containing protein [Treponema sp.]|nr:FIST C-terminal domain-containing protein [Treponema sp.]
MIKMITAYTEEVDEIEDGIAELLGQLDTSALKKNSVGMVTCHLDFVNSGFVEALSSKLPFPFIGMTTLASANKYGQSMYALSLTVLTSDDITFETCISNALNATNYKEEIKAAYSNSAKKLPSEPSMILSFFPFIKEVDGALMHKSLDEICGGIPFWGSLGCNVDGSFENCAIFHTGKVNKAGLAMILVHGPIEPVFVDVSLPSEKIGKTRGQITKSEGSILMEINGIPAQKYLETLGIIVSEGAPIITPLMVYYEGSAEPVALGMYAVNKDGSFLCGGEMPVGAFIAIGEITGDGILSSTEEGIDKILNSGKRNGVLFLPCISRYLMLAPNQTDELALMIRKMENGNIMPFMIGYSGGELCPVPDEKGILRNRFHNYTFTACVF